MVASEVHPFAKTGGLADVLGALPRALAKLGHHVDVVMPRYRGVAAGASNEQMTITLGGQVDVVDVSLVVGGGVLYRLHLPRGILRPRIPVWGPIS